MNVLFPLLDYSFIQTYSLPIMKTASPSIGKLAAKQQIFLVVVVVVEIKPQVHFIFL